MIRRIASGAVTTIVVVAALVLVAWTIFSHVAGASLITFRTGSMTPTMPQGALAVTLLDADADTSEFRSEASPRPAHHHCLAFPDLQVDAARYFYLPRYVLRQPQTDRREYEDPAD